MDYYKKFDTKLKKQDKKHLDKFSSEKSSERKYNLQTRKKQTDKQLKSVKHYGQYLDNLTAMDYNDADINDEKYNFILLDRSDYWESD